MIASKICIKMQNACRRSGLAIRRSPASDFSGRAYVIRCRAALPAGWTGAF
jgi:hypothetical protein